MSRLLQKGAARNKLHMEELKKTMLKSNYDIETGLKPQKLTTPSRNLETAISKPPITNSQHFLEGRLQPPVSSTKNNSSSKKMTLKDYLHLNSIEKKNRTRTSISNSLIESGESMKGDKSMRTAKLRPNNITSTQDLVPQEYKMCETLKKQINQQIEEQMKRLQDLSHYINHDYVPGTCNKYQEKVFFCNIHSTLMKEATLHQQLGEHVLKIQEIAPQNLKRKTRNYFWQNTKKQLTSPAKLKVGMEMTGATFLMFGNNETKRTDDK